jgi:hypothetical protein
VICLLSNGTEPIKWTLGANDASKHKIVSIIQSKLELDSIVSYCPTVLHKIAACIGNKIDACIGNHSANRFDFYMNVFPRTLWLPHVTNDTVLVDHPLIVEDKASFLQAIWHLIAVPAIDKDRHELLDHTHSVAKPRKMEVPMYYSRLSKLNHPVEYETTLMLIYLDFLARNKRLLLVTSVSIKSISYVI